MNLPWIIHKSLHQNIYNINTKIFGIFMEEVLRQGPQILIWP